MKAEPAPRCEMEDREADFAQWADQASPGSSREYFRGWLPVDRDKDQSKLDERSREALNRVADRAWIDKQLALVQRRNGFLDYSYIAQKLVSTRARWT